jgi:hypothetical protein
MMLNLRAVTAVSVLLIATSVDATAHAQKTGGVLKMYIWDNPPSVSMLDGANPIAQRRQWECSTI